MVKTVETEEPEYPDSLPESGAPSAAPETAPVAASSSESEYPLFMAPTLMPDEVALAGLPTKGDPVGKNEFCSHAQVSALALLNQRSVHRVA